MFPAGPWIIPDGSQGLYVQANTCGWFWNIFVCEVKYSCVEIYWVVSHGWVPISFRHFFEHWCCQGCKLISVGSLCWSYLGIFLGNLSFKTLKCHNCSCLDIPSTFSCSAVQLVVVLSHTHRSRLFRPWNCVAPGSVAKVWLWVASSWDCCQRVADNFGFLGLPISSFSFPLNLGPLCGRQFDGDTLHSHVRYPIFG